MFNVEILRITMLLSSVSSDELLALTLKSVLNNGRHMLVYHCDHPNTVGDSVEILNNELTQPRLATSFRRHARECFLLWIGLDSPSGFSDISAALITASALFFIVHPSCLLANLTLNRLHASINQLKPFLRVCILMQKQMGGRLYMQL
jgi:hypothetical protein